MEKRPDRSCLIAWPRDVCGSKAVGCCLLAWSPDLERLGNGGMRMWSPTQVTTHLHPIFYWGWLSAGSSVQRGQPGQTPHITLSLGNALAGGAGYGLLSRDR